MQVTYKVTVEVDTKSKREAKRVANEYINDVLESGIDMALKTDKECTVAIQPIKATTVQDKVKEIMKAWEKGWFDEYDQSANQCLADFWADGLTIDEAFKVYMVVKNKIDGCRYFQKYPDEGLFEFNFKEKDGWFDGETDIDDANVIATY